MNIYKKNTNLKSFYQLAVFTTLIILHACMPVEPLRPPEGREKSGDLTRELYIINGLAQTVSVLNPSNLTIKHDVITTGSAPNDMFFYNGDIFIVNSYDNDIFIYDETTLKQTDRIYLGKSSNPWEIISGKNMHTAYVPGFMNNTVSKISLKRKTVLTNYSTGTRPEGGVILSNQLFICNTGWNSALSLFGEGTVSVFDIQTDTLIKTISVGKNPQKAVAFPDQNEIHVICTGKNGGPDSDDGVISVIDTITKTVKTNLQTGGSPDNFSVDYDNNYVYLAGESGIMLYHYKTHHIIRNSSDYITGGSSGSLLSGVCVDPVNDRIFICNFTEDTIIVLKRGNLKIEKIIQGSDGTQYLFMHNES